MTETPATTTTARGVVAGLTVLLPLIAVLASWFLWQDKLPAELASHWSGNGPADGTMKTTSMLMLSLSLTGIPAVGSIVTALWRGVSAVVLRGVLAACGAIAGIGAVAWLLSASLTMQAGGTHGVVLGWWQLALPASLLFGAIPYFIAPKPSFITHEYTGGIALGPQESGAWSSTITSKTLMLIPAGMLILTAVLFAPEVADGNGKSAAFGIATMLAVTVLVILMARLQVTVDWRGLRVISALGRIPLKRIPLDNIASVEVAQLRPTEWGGWGYRVMPGRSAIIMGAGPGLIVTTTNGKQFAVTVANPKVPAGLLLALRRKANKK